MATGSSDNKSESKQKEIKSSTSAAPAKPADSPKDIVSEGNTMKAAIGKGYGCIEAQFGFTHSFPRPRFDPHGKSFQKRLLMRVQAVGVAPGDVRVLHGDCKKFQGPPSFPYVVGGDLCGQVVETPEPNETGFKVGDEVMCVFEAKPRGALAEYAVVSAKQCVLRPKNVSAVQAAALPSSALSAMIAAEKHVREGDRVLVINGSGGVGTHLVQLLRLHGASFVASVSTQHDLMEGQLKVDRNIDYRRDNWWDLEEFSSEGTKFDLIIDLWGTKAMWNHAKSLRTVKSGWQGGRFVTTVGDHQRPIIQSWTQAIGLMASILGRVIWTRVWRWNPVYTYHVGLSPSGGALERLADHVREGRLQPMLDPRSPFEFTYEGVREALRAQSSKKAHGKLVVEL